MDVNKLKPAQASPHGTALLDAGQAPANARLRTNAVANRKSKCPKRQPSKSVRTKTRPAPQVTVDCVNKARKNPGVEIKSAFLAGGLQYRLRPLLGLCVRNELKKLITFCTLRRVTMPYSSPVHGDTPDGQK